MTAGCGVKSAPAQTEVSVTFNYRFRWQGKTSDTSCRTWPKLSLAAIREARNEARRLVNVRRNPNQQRRIATQDAKDAAAARLAEIERLRTENLTVDDMFKAWLKDGVQRKDDNAEVQRSSARDILPSSGPTPVRELNEHQLCTVLRAIVTCGANRTAVLAYRNLLQMVRWAEKRQPSRQLLANGNPASLLEIEKIVSPDYDLSNTSSRRLTIEEIRALWIALSTACRIGELPQAEWADVDMEKRAWFIPRKNVKGGVRKGQDQLVSLSDITFRQFEALKVLSGETRWLFLATDAEKHVDLESVTKQVPDRQFNLKNRKALKNRCNDGSLVLAPGKHGNWSPHTCAGRQPR